MSTFTVKTVEAAGNVTLKRGTFSKFLLTLDDGSDLHAGVEMLQKPSTSAPTPGQTLEGLLEATQYGPRFRKDYQAGGSQNGSQRASGGYGKSPEESARIVRQHSQGMALQYAALQAGRGKLPEDFKLADLRPMIDWLFEDAMGAKP